MSATSSPSIPSTGTWDIDGVHSTVTISTSHNVVAKWRSQFVGITGSLTDGVLSGSVPVDGLQIAMPIFKEHVLGEGFLDAANHPELKFTSHELHAHEDGTLHLSGEITIKGVTKPISGSGTVTGPTEVTRPDGKTVEALGLTLSAVVDRREFGLEVHAGTGWDVTIDVDLELFKA